MKKAFLVIAITFQLAALLWMALSREYVVQTGEMVKIQTAPIDPRDLFRGDFVRLDYDFSALPSKLLAGHLLDQELKKGQALYVTLQKDSRGLVKPVSVSDMKPDGNALFVRGRLIRNWTKNKYGSSTLALKYGIEQYFVEQGKGIDMENRRGRRNQLQTPMIMQVALSSSGTAIIKDHEWGDFGVKLTVQRQPERDADITEASAVLQLELKNVSRRNLVLPLKPGACSFRIQSIKTAPRELALTGENCDQSDPEQVAFNPDDSRVFTFDLNQAQWHVLYKDEHTPMGKLPWDYRFRLIYDESVEHINGDIVSQAFHGRGQID
ncbi:MAG: GDYXXLXY domain-containing protein [Gammaproteobacteria bacterium]|nr:GDYXXLXY domain-containing protein [Gammaproteobacteria bacterium]